MAKTTNSVIIDRPRSLVFNITNELNNWPRLFTEYEKVRVLSRDGNKISFQLTTFGDEKHKSMTWRSSRVIDRDNWFISAKRETPMYPWTHMNIEWLYEEVENGTKLTFIQDFGVDPTTGHSDEDAIKFINENSKKEMENIKKVLESGDFDNQIP